jgi:hypothetical protein
VFTGLIVLSSLSLSLSLSSQSNGGIVSCFHASDEWKGRRGLGRDQTNEERDYFWSEKRWSQLLLVRRDKEYNIIPVKSVEPLTPQADTRVREMAPAKTRRSP